MATAQEQASGITPARVRWNVALLAFTQALFMCVMTMQIATTPLAGHALLGVDKTLATLPLVLNHIGIMLTTIPASLLMARIGRRAGFSIGTLLSISSGIVSVSAIYQQSFVGLCVGALLQGTAAAFAWYMVLSVRGRGCRRRSVSGQGDLARHGWRGRGRAGRATSREVGGRMA